MGLKYQDIFVPGGFPSHTYNPRAELELEGRLSEARENLCKLVTITGQTKSGKTVLTSKVFPRDGAVWVDGGTVSEEGDFWDSIIAQLELYQSIETESSAETSGKIGATAAAEAKFLVAKGSGEIGAEIGTARASSFTKARSVSSRVAALDGLRNSRLPLIIDDFHYIPKDIQGGVIRALKPLIFEGHPAAVIAIPHRRYDALKVEKEMTGRISRIDIPVWSDSELRYIPEHGFRLLNYKLSDEIIGRLVAESIGSPHLMQDFCRAICRARQLEAAGSESTLVLSDEELTGVFKDVAETIGRPIFEKLARGPRQRTDRLQRELKSGGAVDIYQLVLRGLARLRPGLISFEYEQLRAAIKEISSVLPQAHEVTRVLKHMATIASTDQSSTPVIDFEEEERKVHITDPFFAYYLRWGELAKEA